MALPDPGAILAHHRLPIVHLVPPGPDPDLVARVIPGPATPTDPTIRALAGAIPRRRTCRLPFHRVPVPGEVIAELVGAASGEGATLQVADPHPGEHAADHRAGARLRPVRHAARGRRARHRRDVHHRVIE